MKENLRKHILSEYTNIAGWETTGAPTLNTEAVEISDPDEFMLQSEGPTMLTENIELSDPDEFGVLGPTLFTKSIEASDPDEFCLSEEISKSSNMLVAQTRHTYTVETSDEDEFLLM